MRVINYRLRGNSRGMRTLLCALVVIVLMIGNMVTQGCKQTKVDTPSQGAETSKPTGKQLTNSIGMKFVLIEAGSFQMGGEKHPDEKPIHKVKISRPFYMQTTEVTQAQWEAVMGNNPSHFKGADRPVENVSWFDCQEFIKQLNAKEGTDKYRLPSEAEWEYACRAGCTEDCLEDLDEKAWSGKNSGKETHPVGQKKPNAWGFYDMQGNVWEWCQDWSEYGGYHVSIITGRGFEELDPKGTRGPEMASHVLRGGSWDYDDDDYFRCAYRSENHPDISCNFLGFRVARTQ